MKKNFLLFLLLLSFKLNAQSKDTIFLKRTIMYTPFLDYDAIFIDSSLKEKKIITDFRFGDFDSASYFDGLIGLRPLIKHKLPINFPSKWIRLYSYKGTYYLYHPSEMGLNYKFEITDSTTKDFVMEGPLPSRINKISLITPSHIVIDRSNPWKGRMVEINIINKEKGIAVFKFRPTKYSLGFDRVLMVDVTKANLFPLINNYSPYNKQFEEFEFDKIDFDKLLK